MTHTIHRRGRNWLHLAMATAMLSVAACTAPETEISKAEFPAAAVTGGTVRGEVADNLVVFKGIPYAAPPTGELRWKAPQPVTAWEGELSTQGFKPACAQKTTAFTPPGPKPDEDCLYLNVWAPLEKSAEPLPVMVWIHGGAFTTGAPTAPFFDGTAFANRGVILVSIAYRLGPIGFLAHPELSAESGLGSGNYGLLDQVAALQWVHDNIREFGGDPARVTIFGQSAGASGVSILTATPLAKGLLQRAIAESGGSFAPPAGPGERGMMSELADAEAAGVEMLNALGVSSIAEARALSAEAVLEAPGPYRPNIDGYLLPDDVYDIYASGGQNDVPVLVGYNSDEGGGRGSRIVTPQQFEAQISGSYGSYASEILAVYPHANDVEATQSSKDIFRDSAFGWNARTWANIQQQTGQGAVYTYYFDQVAPEDSMFYSPGGTSHTGEVPYVFGMLDPNTSYTDVDKALSNTMQSYWVNFATSGDPNGAGLPEWTSYAQSPGEVMMFTGEPAMAPAPNFDKLSAFDGYYAKQRKGAD